MGFTDKNALFSDAQQVTTTGGAEDSTDIVHWPTGSNANYQVTIGKPLYLQIQVKAQFAAAGTLVVVWNTDGALNAGGTALSSANAVWTSPTITLPAAVDDTAIYIIPLPRDLIEYEQYNRLHYTVATTNADYLITAGVVETAPENVDVIKGYSIE